MERKGFYVSNSNLDQSGKVEIDFEDEEGFTTDHTYYVLRIIGDNVELLIPSRHESLAKTTLQKDGDHLSRWVADAVT